MRMAGLHSSRLKLQITQRTLRTIKIGLIVLLALGWSISGSTGSTESSISTSTSLLTPGVVNNWLHRSKLSVRTYEDFYREPQDPAPTPTPTITPTPQVAVAPKPAPIKSAPIVGSHVLGWPLTHPTKVNTYFSSAHKAIDLEAKCGEQVLASFAGQVTYAGWKTNGGGIVVDVVADNGLILNYVHLSAVAVGAGDRVSVGQVIGYSGKTGVASGCHLHFGVRKNGVNVNPLLYL